MEQIYGRKGNGKAKLQTSHIYIDFMKNICVASIQFNMSWNAVRWLTVVGFQFE